MVKVRCRPLLWACVLWLSASCGVPPQALAQEATSHQHEQGRAKRTHPPQDMALHEKFYSTWRMPDNPALSCCNNADCYPTDIRYVDGRIYAKRREDGKYILIPPQKVERSRDNPDGRNHLCAAARSVEFIRYRLLLRSGRRHVRFVLVNGRMPFRQSFCALCCEPIGKVGYLRDIRTRLCYCGGECYALKSGDCFSKIKPRFLEQGFLKCRSESSGILKVVGRHEVHPGQS